ncbi:hypothetical protein S646_003441 [Salmonella enterica subsp. enterica]|nr:hypothetical protein [Salmonella enterica subsp. enterica serovar Newport]EBB2410705.1 hypothetical protein [Salmonella enterica]ECE0286665.1 hypothetical protein [Salmonella enterica subsp. enterica]EDW8028244.1 hypothetical protein [Salmonella enterica subsp. enterica serovar Singapore]EDR9185133.1 hypothetical protein [Salmonella enterica subsp. enterica]
MTTNNKPTVRTTTGATVTVTIQVSNLGVWGPDCQMEQIYRQAIVEAKSRVARALNSRDFKFVGEPVVRAITTDMEQRP